MLKENKWKILITTLIVLLPILVGCILWDRLPDTIATHFGVDNEPNGWNSKTFAVFGLPGVMAALHLFCLIATSVDPKQKNIGKKALGIVFWIMPATSLIMCTMTYAVALGVQVDVGFVAILFIGLLLIVLGNRMPKAKQNYSFGIKTPWALDGHCRCGACADVFPEKSVDSVPGVYSGWGGADGVFLCVLLPP